jgi:predicted DCC family thiol-disulfide oxidoreductase YuxK
MNQRVAVLIFDGYCNLCGAIVRLVKRHDRKGRFEFVPAQTERGGRLLKEAGLIDTGTGTVVLAIEDKFYLRSTAALRVFRLLGGGWRLLYGLIIIPRFIRDFVYDIIAKTRYRLFGRSSSCYIP